jgi:hypothetical protein
MGMRSALVGYSLKQDKLIRYPVVSRFISEHGKVQHDTAYDADYLFLHKLNAHDSTRYQIDYRGRMGTLDKHSYIYVPEKELFEGRIIQVGSPEND